MDISLPFDPAAAWLAGGGPDAAIAVTSRVRLARNLANHNFPTHPDQSDRSSVLSDVRNAFQSLPDGDGYTWCEIDRQSNLERHLLLESHLISRELADGTGPRALAFNPAKSISVMVNEEDHLRMQALCSGLRLKDAFASVDQLDNAIASRLAFAYSPLFGYLTSCPTNVGTGLRASVMLHLPALVMTSHIEKVFRAIYEMHMAVRGFYGEGTEAMGDFYQISNQITCGRSENDILADMEASIKAIISYENRAREELLERERPRLEDVIWRSWGILEYARQITSEEAMRHLSNLRLGVVTKILDSLTLESIQRLLLLCQPAHLQQIEGHNLESDERDIARATFLRGSLSLTR
ncbi:MAG: protein arginine kinase [Planctomycetota bacterium]|jgi:protein arginine kinase|nr:protein arginine kinase [Planctomycetota bacterium]